MAPIRSLQRRVFLATFAVAVLPAAALLGLGTLALRQTVAVSGTAGPWDSVAESGRILLEHVERVAPADPLMAGAAERHREALSESVRFSRFYAFLSGRFLRVLPVLALATAAVVALLALLAARGLSRSVSGPIRELVGWTGRIARREPLPSPGRERDRGVREFEALRSALRDMADELEAARRREVESARLRSWTEMARRVAHELKNPLTPMRLAATRIARQEDAASVEAAEVLLEEIGKLDEMARSFAQFGRMPEGPPSDVDLGELLDALVDRHRVPEITVELRIDPGTPTVRGHHEALGRVFRNLLVNALEAAESGDGKSPGRVDVHVAPVSGGAEVVVRDSGPGLPEVEPEEIWRPGFTTKRRGSGLGLPLVRQTVDAHGGTTTAEAAAGGGAAFRVWLPASTPHR